MYLDGYISEYNLICIVLIGFRLRNLILILFYEYFFIFLYRLKARLQATSVKNMLDILCPKRRWSWFMAISHKQMFRSLFTNSQYHLPKTNSKYFLPSIIQSLCCRPINYTVKHNSPTLVLCLFTLKRVRRILLIPRYIIFGHYLSSWKLVPFSVMHNV